MKVITTFLWGCIAAVCAFAEGSAFYVNYNAVVPTVLVGLRKLDHLNG